MATTAKYVAVSAGLYVAAKLLARDTRGTVATR
jgi:hypothetical protein